METTVDKQTKRINKNKFNVDFDAKSSDEGNSNPPYTRGNRLVLEPPDETDSDSNDIEKNYNQHHHYYQR